MRLVHVTPTYLPAVRYGGPIYSVHGLCKALAARGHVVDVLTTSVDGADDSAVPHGVPVPMDGVQVWYHQSRHLRRLYASPTLAASIWKLLPQADLVHSHAVFLFPGLAAARMASWRGKPFVISPRGMLVRDLIEMKSGLTKRVWIRAFEKGNLAKAQALHFTSRQEQLDFNALGLPSQQQWVIPNGLEIASVQQPPPTPSGEVLFIGRVNWKKGLDVLIRALPLAPSARLTVAGNDEENYLPALRALAAECGVADRVTFVGHADATLKAKLLQKSMLLVLPSLSENFGNVVLEAWSACRPVLLTPGVGLAEAVVLSGGGKVVEYGPAAVGAALREMLADPDLSASMGLRGWEYASAHYGWPVVAAQVESQYFSLLANRE